MDFSHDHAAILSIGDELVRGQMLDTNSRDLSARLMDLGIPTVEHLTVGDDLHAICNAILHLTRIAPLVITTGGLGPTLDDLTRDALAAALNEQLIEDPHALATLEVLLRARNRPITPSQRLQSLRPSSARCLENPNGTAPGLQVLFNLISSDSSPRHRASDVFCLPGPPGEWLPMFQRFIVPCIRQPGSVIRTHLIRLFGLGESQAADLLPGLMVRNRSPQVGITASGGVLTWRILSSNCSSIESAQLEIAETSQAIRAAMGDYIFAQGPGPNVASLEQVVIDALKARSRSVATVESCTGGLIGQMLTEIPGSSAAFLGGIISYSNALKSELVDVNPQTIASFGAVSREVVIEMAQGGQRHLGADYVLAVSGIAGPDGGTPTKPVGTVWIALASPDAIHTKCFRIPGTRRDVRTRAATAALAMLEFKLRNSPALDRSFLWEVSP